MFREIQFYNVQRDTVWWYSERCIVSTPAFGLGKMHTFASNENARKYNWFKSIFSHFMEYIWCFKTIFYTAHIHDRDICVNILMGQLTFFLCTKRIQFHRRFINFFPSWTDRFPLALTIFSNKCQQLDKIVKQFESKE